jgi:hypothetical protein
MPRWRRALVFAPVLVVVGIVVVGVASSAPAAALRAMGAPRWSRALAGGVGALGGLWLLGRFVERRGATHVGLARRGLGAQMAAGAVLGAVMMSVSVGVLAGAGWYRASSATFDSAVVLRALALFLGVALAEEVVARGIVLRVLEERYGSVPGLLVSSALFGAGHLGNDHATLLAAASIAVSAGLILGAVWMLTRTLWVAVGVHWTWNLFEGTVYGTPVSGLKQASLVRARLTGPTLWTGGHFGPEAGLAVLVVGSGIAALLLAIAHRRGAFVSPRRAGWLPSGEAAPPAGSSPPFAGVAPPPSPR